MQEMGGSCGNRQTALDLGCGSGEISALLLQANWRVKSVDFSRAAIDVLQETVARRVAQMPPDSLCVECTSIENYSDDTPRDLVVAADVLPYLDPQKFRDTWQKITSLVKPGGYFIGTFFRADGQPDMALNLMAECGAWFLPDRRMVRVLLDTSGFDVKRCVFRKDDEDSSIAICVQFIAQKRMPAAE